MARSARNNYVTNKLLKFLSSLAKGTENELLFGQQPWSNFIKENNHYLVGISRLAKMVRPTSGCHIPLKLSHKRRMQCPLANHENSS